MQQVIQCETGDPQIVFGASADNAPARTPTSACRSARPASSRSPCSTRRRAPTSPAAPSRSTRATVPAASPTAGNLFLQPAGTSNFNSVAISGTVSLAGKIAVGEYFTFTPAAGNQFQILSFGPTANPGDFQVKTGYYLGPNKVLTEQIGSTTAPASVGNGHASANFPLATTVGAGTYTIKAYYTPGFKAGK